MFNQVDVYKSTIEDKLFVKFWIKQVYCRRYLYLGFGL